MIFMASRDAFDGFTFATISVENIPVFVVVMISPSLMDSSMFFFQSKLLIYCIDLKHMMSFWWLILFFIGLFFIFSLGSVICKKYTNANGKDSKYTNAIDISITGSCGMGRGKRLRVICRGRDRKRRLVRRGSGRQLIIF